VPTPITLQRTTTPKQRPEDVRLTFGTSFSDHMFVAEYHEGKGWHDPRIIPYGSFDLDPATCMFHYGQAIFDGLKGFRGTDGTVRLFRPQAHAARLNRSAERLCIPALDPELVVDSFLRLVDVDRSWVPSARGTAIYLRPTVIASERFLAVRPAKSYLYFLILSPVGAYYAEGADPVSILATEEFTRAAPGGLGAAKTPANYAASLLAAEQAKKTGFTQVLWLDGVERRWLEEVGTMNIMVKIKGEVATPPLGDSILAGVTRDSILTLCKDWGIPCRERRIAIDEVVAAARDGTLEEMWGTGTAAVVSPVGEIGYRGERVKVADGKTGALTQRLYDAITAIQYAEAPDPHGWAVEVPRYN
jgi:branched-chain amino acid aminotransferase